MEKGTYPFRCKLSQWKLANCNWTIECLFQNSHEYSCFNWNTMSAVVCEESFKYKKLKTTVGKKWKEQKFSTMQSKRKKGKGANGKRDKLSLLT